VARLPHAAGARLAFLWEGRVVEARAGDTVAAALYAAGHRMLTRSRKFHRPRGLSGVFVADHLARVDGRPNVRLDDELVREGHDVRAQNVWPDLDRDLLRLARLIPRRWLRAGFEHTRLIPSGTPLFERWEAMLRFLAGVAERPPADQRIPAMAGRRIAADVVVVGGGPSGRRAAAEAAGQGASVVLVSRGTPPGAFARAGGAALPDLPESVTVLAEHEAFGLYRDGRLVGAAPRDGGAATAIDAGCVVLAVGRRSCPPLVPGADLPGVLDLHTALALAHDHGVAPGGAVAVIGTGDVEAVARRFAALSVGVGAVLETGRTTRILGNHAVAGIEADGRVLACDAVVHAGPWRTDPALGFQAATGGALRLIAQAGRGNVTVVGSAAEAPEPVVWGGHLDDAALVCPCMDVTVAEVRALAAAGEAHVEVIKRLTGCGMGACQGFPCWDQLGAALAALTGRAVDDRPTFRPPRGALTLAQAAGLAEVVGPEP